MNASTTVTVFDPSASAALLLDAWRSGRLLDALPPELRPATLAQGYDTQDRLMAAAGGTRAGWKLGVGSAALQRAAQLSRPLVGQLEQSRCHAPGALVRVPADAPVTVECEIAFVLARDIAPGAPRGVGPEDIRSTCVTFELVRSRFVNRRAVGWPSFTADNVGFEALVVGESVCAGLDVELLREIDATAVVSLDGVPTARALSGDDATHPLLALGALLDHANERGITLRAGDIVSTGAMCQPFDVTGRGHELTASYLGRELSFRI